MNQWQCNRTKDSIYIWEKKEHILVNMQKWYIYQWYVYQVVVKHFVIVTGHYSSQTSQKQYTLRHSHRQQRIKFTETYVQNCSRRCVHKVRHGRHARTHAGRTNINAYKPSLKTRNTMMNIFIWNDCIMDASHFIN